MPELRSLAYSCEVDGVQKIVSGAGADALPVATPNRPAGPLDQVSCGSPAGDYCGMRRCFAR